LTEVSPQGSEDFEESSDTESSDVTDEIAVIASALADSTQIIIDQQQRCGTVTAGRAETSSASLKEQKREEIRKAVAIQRAELDRGQKH
jgi:hypothetical protein